MREKRIRKLWRDFIKRVECISAGCPEAAARAFAAKEAMGTMEEGWDGNIAMAGYGDIDT